MPELIGVTIDVTLVDKDRLIPSKKEGSKAKYLSIVLIPLREPDRYGNQWMVKPSSTKKEREAKVQLPILGSAKVLAGARTATNGGPSAKHTAPSEPDPVGDRDDQVPF